MITGRELDAEKARKYVELLLCASGEAVLAVQLGPDGPGRGHGEDAG